MRAPLSKTPENLVIIPDFLSCVLDLLNGGEKDFKRLFSLAVEG
jgi:hypothetical protein